MPSHITHIIIARKIFDNKKDIEIDEDYFVTFSLGADLSKFSKVRKLSHKIKQRELIENMCNYLIENKLMDDKYLLSTIYGHISHMVSDNVIHPLIYKEVNRCMNKKLRNHTLIESYYDAFLLKKIFNLNVLEFDLKNILCGNVSRIAKMLDYAYYKTYGYKNISRYYRLMLFSYRNFSILYKFFGINNLIKISRYNIFLKDNISCINKEEFISLYKRTINESLIHIKNTELYLKSASN